MRVPPAGARFADSQTNGQGLSIRSADAQPTQINAQPTQMNAVEPTQLVGIGAGSLPATLIASQNEEVPSGLMLMGGQPLQGPTPIIERGSEGEPPSQQEAPETQSEGGKDSQRPSQNGSASGSQQRRGRRGKSSGTGSQQGSQGSAKAGRRASGRQCVELMAETEDEFNDLA